MHKDQVTEFAPRNAEQFNYFFFLFLLLNQAINHMLANFATNVSLWRAILGHTWRHTRMNSKRIVFDVVAAFCLHRETSRMEFVANVKTNRYQSMKRLRMKLFPFVIKSSVTNPWTLHRYSLTKKVQIVILIKKSQKSHS